MLFIKWICFVLIISLVNSVPVDESKIYNRNRPSTRRAILEMYRYNHPPSISIPVSVVFEENVSENDESGKSLKVNTESSNKKTKSSYEPSSDAIPVSVVLEEPRLNIDKSKSNYVVASKESKSLSIPVSVLFEEKTSGSIKTDNSTKLDEKISTNNKTPIQKPLETNPKKESQTDTTLKTKIQNPDINLKKITISSQQSDIAVPVAVVFEEDKVSKIYHNKPEKSEKLSHESSNKYDYTKETKMVQQHTEPPILTSTDSVMSSDDIEVPTITTISAKAKPKKEESKVILKPQPRQYLQLEYQIPVAVVYDEPINVVQRSRKVNKSNEQIRARNSRRHRPTSASTTESTIEATTNNDDIQKKLVKGEHTHKSRRRHRVKQTQEMSSEKENIPVVIKFTETGNQTIQSNNKEEKLRTNPLPTTEAGIEKLTSNTITQSKTPLQNQNRNSSFKAQQTEEKKQDESVSKRQRDPVVPIIKSDNYSFGNSGSFSYSYEGGDGTKAFEKGELKTFEDDKTGEAVVGGFSYKDKDGNDISLSYTADENGYRPVGEHLPTPPPIPVAIQRALAYLATKTTPAPVTEAGEVIH